MDRLMVKWVKHYKMYYNLRQKENKTLCVLPQMQNPANNMCIYANKCACGHRIKCRKEDKKG